MYFCGALDFTKTHTDTHWVTSPVIRNHFINKSNDDKNKQMCTYGAILWENKQFTSTSVSRIRYYVSVYKWFLFHFIIELKTKQKHFLRNRILLKMPVYTDKLLKVITCMLTWRRQPTLNSLWWYTSKTA